MNDRDTAATLERLRSAEGLFMAGQVAMSTEHVDALMLDDLRKTPARAMITPAFALEGCYGFRIGGLQALEFLKQAVLAFDLGGTRFAVRTTGQT